MSMMLLGRDPMGNPASRAVLRGRAALQPAERRYTHVPAADADAVDTFFTNVRQTPPVVASAPETIALNEGELHEAFGCLRASLRSFYIHGRWNELKMMCRNPKTAEAYKEWQMARQTSTGQSDVFIPQVIGGRRITRTTDNRRSHEDHLVSVCLPGQPGQRLMMRF